MILQTEFEFSLPKGFVDQEGSLHQNGVMRLATGADEILPQKDPRVQANPAYLAIIVLSRVVTKLGDLTTITPKTMEELFSGDLAFLQDFYRRINENGTHNAQVICPECKHQFESNSEFLGG